MLGELPNGAESVVVGVALVVTGYLIAFRGWTFLIAGYDRTSVADPELVGDVVGYAVIRIGIAVAVVGGLRAAGHGSRLVDLVLVAVILLVVARTLYRVNVVVPRRAAEANGE